jgi:hypothetical protein
MINDKQQINNDGGAYFSIYFFHLTNAHADAHFKYNLHLKRAVAPGADTASGLAAGNVIIQDNLCILVCVELDAS